MLCLKLSFQWSQNLKNGKMLVSSLMVETCEYSWSKSCCPLKRKVWTLGIVQTEHRSDVQSSSFQLSMSFNLWTSTHCSKYNPFGSYFFHLVTSKGVWLAGDTSCSQLYSLVDPSLRLPCMTGTQYLLIPELMHWAGSPMVYSKVMSTDISPPRWLQRVVASL